MVKHKVILIIRDGWGYRESCQDNAICEGETTYTDELMKEYPNILIDASGEAVGLPDGTQGNSEVGHMTIGSGRIIMQSLLRINKSIESGEFFEKQPLIDAIENCKKNNSTLHIMGLLQTQAVHSHIHHLFAVLDMCKRMDFSNVLVHAFTDGRDAPVHESLVHVQSLLEKFEECRFGKVASISGRYYAMDRDNRWDRTKKAYDCIVNTECEERFDDPVDTIKKSHERDETDEFIVPKCASWYKGVQENDSMIFFNFRTDRTRQLTKAIVEQEFEGWERKPLNVYYLAMTEFYKPMNAQVIFEDQFHKNLLGEVVSKEGLNQLRISETEKYAHVTFFFNGQIEIPNKNEERILIHSPKVATYDLQPEMSVFEIRDNLVEQINGNKYEMIVTNLVNGDLVGHTGIKEACLKAVHSVDQALKDIVEAGLANEYTILIFADHGNIEDQTPEWRTSHTINPVPCILVSGNEELKACKLKKGKGLKDIAPTALELLGIAKPEEMTGESLIDY